MISFAEGVSGDAVVRGRDFLCALHSGKRGGDAGVCSGDGG
jgi:hypothetical protein